VVGLRFRVPGYDRRGMKSGVAGELVVFDQIFLFFFFPRLCEATYLVVAAIRQHPSAKKKKKKKKPKMLAWWLCESSFTR
jgi:hypothetical protein